MNKGYLEKLKRRANRVFGLKSVFQGEYHEANSCRRKVRYSKASAIRASEQMHSKTGDEFQVYECEFCHGFHIGHPKAKIKLTVSRSAQ